MRKILFILSLFILFVPSVSAHSGRTDSSGCHNCYTSYCYGEYHCHNGGGSYGGYVAPITPKNPVGEGTHTFIPHTNEALYDLQMDWGDTSALSYSIAISKTAGGNPGPNPDTNSSDFLFRNIAPGRWYVNIKANVGGRWSEIAYWTIDVPWWVKPTPTPTTIVTPTVQADNDTSENSASGDILALFLVGGGIAGVWALSNKEKV